MERFSYLAKKLSEEFRTFLENLPEDGDPFKIRIPKQIFEIWADLLSVLRTNPHIHPHIPGIFNHTFLTKIIGQELSLMLAILAEFLNPHYEDSEDNGKEDF